MFGSFGSCELRLGDGVLPDEGDASQWAGTIVPKAAGPSLSYAQPR